MSKFLTKSDFKVASTCPTKLYYRKHRYPTTRDDDQYLRLLADGGYIVEKMARLLFPEGQEMPSTPRANAAFAQTLEALSPHRATLFEATIISDGKLARIDVLSKRGGHFNLYEVKAKAYDSDANRRRLAVGKPNLFRSTRGGILPTWLPYLEDVTFQTLVLNERFPEATITPYLILPDKAKRATAASVNGRFTIERPPGKSGFDLQRVTYTGDVDRLREEHVLTAVNVAREVADLLPEVAEAARRFLRSLRPSLTRLQTELSLHCRSCEFRAMDARGRSGFRECWGELAEPQPHLFDMYQVQSIGDGEMLANRLIAQGKASLFDIPLPALGGNAAGPRAQRQQIQLVYSHNGQEWLSESLGEQLGRFRYPLQFIDFETTSVAVPYFAGMRPYEMVAFQWSCHVLREPGGELEHFEWVDTSAAFPNFAFAEALMETLDLDGTIFIWAAHENTVLRKILEQLRRRGWDDPTLRDWLTAVTRANRDDDTPLVDMQALTLKHYFHPQMGGSTSIKVVADAIWQSNPTLRERFPGYVHEVDGVLLSPYAALPRVDFEGDGLVVAEGTGAMRAYQTLVDGRSQMSRAEREKWLQLLRQYCRLDTLAMVMVFWHWEQLWETAVTAARGTAAPPAAAPGSDHPSGESDN